MLILRICIVLVVASTLLAAQTVPGARSLDVRVSDAVYDKSTDRIYAVLSPTSPQSAQSVVVINPIDLSIAASLPLAIPATSLKLSDDGRYLYAVAHNTPSTVFRINTLSMSLEAQYSPIYSESHPDSKITQVLALPGRLGSLAISFTDQYGNYIGTAAFDGETRLPRALGRSESRISTLLVGPVDGILYGIGGSISRIRIREDGLEQIGDPIPAGSVDQMIVSRGLLYASHGKVLDVESGTQEGVFPDLDFTGLYFASAVVVDEPSNLIYFAKLDSPANVYLAYDTRTFRPVASLTITQNRNLQSLSPKKLLVTNGGDLVSFDGQNSRLIFLPTSSLTSFQSFVIPAVRDVVPGIRILRVPAGYMTGDAANGQVHFVLPGRIPGIGS